MAIPYQGGDDVFGFTHEARDGAPRAPSKRKLKCMTLEHHYRIMHRDATNWTPDQPVWLWRETQYGRRYKEVLRGERRCPLVETCDWCKRLLSRETARLRYPDLYPELYRDSQPRQVRPPTLKVRLK